MCGFFSRLWGLIRLLAETTKDEQSGCMDLVTCKTQEQQAGIGLVHCSVFSSEPYPWYNVDTQKMLGDTLT